MPYMGKQPDPEVIMYKYIGIEDLAANALIELLERKNCREVSFEVLRNYGMTIVRILTAAGKGAILTMNQEDTYNMLHDYSDFFDIKESNGQESIILKTGKTAQDLRTHFRAYLGLDSLIAFTTKESIQVLGIAV